MEQEAASGLSLPAPLAYYDPDTSSLRTCQDSLALMLEPDSTESSPTWPKSGILASGRLYPLPTLERRTAESGCSLWPTPNCMDHLGQRSPEAHEYQMRRGSPDGSRRSSTGNLREDVMLWKTPVVPNGGRALNKATSITGKKPDGGKAQVDLNNEVRMWATPTVSESTGAGDSPQKQGGESLRTQAANWPTPMGGDYTPESHGQISGQFRRQMDEAIDSISASSSPSPAADSGTRGSLAVPFVESLMGFESGWTELPE